MEAVKILKNKGEETEEEEEDENIHFNLRVLKILVDWDSR